MLFDSSYDKCRFEASSYETASQFLTPGKVGILFWRTVYLAAYKVPEFVLILVGVDAFESLLYQVGSYAFLSQLHGNFDFTPIGKLSFVAGKGTGKAAVVHEASLYQRCDNIADF